MGSSVEDESHRERRKRHNSPSVSPEWQSRPIKKERMSPDDPDKRNKKGDSRYKHERKHKDDHRHDRSRDSRPERESPEHRSHKYNRDGDDMPRSSKKRREDSPGDRHRKRGHDRTDTSGNSSKGKPEFGKEKPKDKEKPNFGLSGKLAEDTNVFNGVVIKYNEPSEARKPKRRWRLYPFKADESLPFIAIHRQSAYLLGRSRLVADIPIDHPSCSKQHAVLQFRLVDYEREDGTTGKRVRPYIIDLDSANGTFVNNKQVDPRRYVELLEKDVIKFGFSSREYVLLHEDSKGDQEDDNVVEV